MSETPNAERGDPDRPRLSVCMATYNGARYVEEQIASILPQLGDDDELVVIDDGSTDDTYERVAAIGDPRIALSRAGQNRGYVRTFENAIAQSGGDVILLSDQDDRWLPGRVDAMLKALGSSELVVSNFSSFGRPLTRVQSRRLRSVDGPRWRRNIFWIWVGTRPYYGCCMAFRRELVAQLLPFPSYLTETHDQWIGYVANANRSVVHLERDTVERRVHDTNASARGDRPLTVVLRARLMTARAILEAFRRQRRNR